MFPVFACIHSHIVNTYLRITELVEFYHKLLVFLWYILFEDDSTSEEHNDLINC